MADVERASDPTYILGHSERELARLRTQAALLEPVTRRYLQEAGITAGMRVLDVGSGAGDVALLAADLVGPAGEVVGTDAVATAVAAATRAAEERSLENVRFQQGNPAEMTFDAPFDAVVGRYFLPFQADPAAMLRGLARHLAPGGLLVFHEPDFSCVRSLPPAPLYDRACRWIIDTTRLSGQSWSFLDKVYPAFLQAELPAPTLRMQTFVANPSHARPWLWAVGDMVESILPAIERHRVATAAEVDVATLRERLLAEVTQRDCVVVGRSEIGIWTTVGQ
ncbi:MAG: class I SAM-dependent methyltransferase [Planctomycetota bacterium]|nr:MAG: class I SAM-dependent methyltransferase [Planctomycetota bacterium]